MSWLLRGLAVWGLVLITACGRPPGGQVFVTDYGLGPDKWATAWLLTRQVSPGAKLLVVDINAPLPDGIAFDVPGSGLLRQGNQAAFQVAQDLYAVDDPDVRRLAQIVHDIEVNFWTPEKIPESPLVEQAFRRLQKQQERDSVTPECYLAFFDQVYDALREQRVAGRQMSMDDLSIDCRAMAAAASSAMLVPEMPIASLLAEMKRGKSVIFVDVREADEFSEAHIPGAINVTLRDLNPDVVSRVKQADYVVSYCVKDFRGFEMAKALRDAGVRNSVILKPYGIKGWVVEGLPTTGTMALGQKEAAERMAECLAIDQDCLAILSQ